MLEFWTAECKTKLNIFKFLKMKRNAGKYWQQFKSSNYNYARYFVKKLGSNIDTSKKTLVRTAKDHDLLFWPLVEWTFLPLGDLTRKKMTNIALWKWGEKNITTKQKAITLFCGVFNSGVSGSLSNRMDFAIFQQKRPFLVNVGVTYQFVRNSKWDSFFTSNIQKAAR